MPRRARVWLTWVGWLALLAAVTAALLPFRASLNEAQVALAYLLLVQLASARHGRAIGLALTGLAFLCFDWFFLPPYYTLLLAKPIDWLVLVAFLVTSVVATQLFERARNESILRETARLKDAVIASVSHDLRTPL